MRIGLVGLGVGLGILFLVGLSQHADAWLVWIECALAIVSLAVALLPVERLRAGGTLGRHTVSTTGGPVTTPFATNMTTGGVGVTPATTTETRHGTLDALSTATWMKATPIAIGVGLIGLWIVALAVGTVAWMAWWTFAVGLAYLLFGAALMTTPTEERFARAHATSRR